MSHELEPATASSSEWKSDGLVTACDEVQQENSPLLSSSVEAIAERRPLLPRVVSTASIIGTVKLNDGGLVYIPTPTADPRDPLNMKRWQKTVVVVVVCSFSTIAISLIQGFGGIISFYLPQYLADGKSDSQITSLMTYPALFMGLGNFIGMPLAIAVGRRSVMLISTITLFIGTVLCALSNSLESHLFARSIIGLAAGQAESVVPLIIQEIHFLHERAGALMSQQAIQVIGCGVWVLCASPIASALSAPWWYGLGAVLVGLQFLISLFLLPETMYDRPEVEPEDALTRRKSCIVKPPLDYEQFEPRTWASDLRLWIGKPQWHKTTTVLKSIMKLFFFPNVLWASCLTGITLGVCVSMSTTYSIILTRPPYNWQPSTVSLVNCGQIPVALVCFPLLGYASDKLIQLKARRNDGMYEPETRLIMIIIPFVVGLITVVLYGQGAAHPDRYHWFLYLWAMAGYFFAFVGTGIVVITYLLDSYPTVAGPVLVTVSASRGVFCFLISVNVARFIGQYGYDGTFTAFAVITGVLGLLVLPLYYYGKDIRKFTARWTKDGAR